MLFNAAIPTLHTINVFFFYFRQPNTPCNWLPMTWDNPRFQHLWRSPFLFRKLFYQFKKICSSEATIQLTLLILQSAFNLIWQMVSLLDDYYIFQKKSLIYTLKRDKNYR